MASPTGPVKRRGIRGPPASHGSPAADSPHCQAGLAVTRASRRSEQVGTRAQPLAGGRSGPGRVTV